MMGNKWSVLGSENVVLGTSFVIASVLLAAEVRYHPLDFLPLRELLVAVLAVIGVHLLGAVLEFRPMRRIVESSIRSSISNPVVQGAVSCGLTDIFPSREQAVDEIVRRLPHARARAWFAGITFSQYLRIDREEIRDILAGHVEAGRDVRILLLDALRSPGVFRVLLECKPEEADNLLDHDRAPEAENLDLYFSRDLYNRFERVFGAFEADPRLHRTVRFYGQWPPCWLVVIDDTAYFVPFTFARVLLPDGTRAPVDTHIPVFKIERTSKAKTYEALVDHFEKLWSTSDLDLFHAAMKIKQREDIIRRIFRVRRWWLTKTCRVLLLRLQGRESRMDRRTYPRLPCQADSIESNVMPLEVVLEGPSGRAIATLIDYSREGIGVRVTRGGPVPKKHEGVRVYLSEENPRIKVAEMAFHYFSKRQLIVSRVGNDGLVVGLKCVDPMKWRGNGFGSDSRRQRMKEPQRRSAQAASNPDEGLNH